MEKKTKASFHQSFAEKKYLVHTIICTSRIQEMFEDTAGDFPTSQWLIHLPSHSTEKC